MIELKKGDYVLATKYTDGDPNDHFCVGYFDRMLELPLGNRYLIIGNDGSQFRHNGFRRAEKITTEEGNWIVDNMKMIEQCTHRSVWSWIEDMRNNKVERSKQ